MTRLQLTWWWEIFYTLTCTLRSASQCLFLWESDHIILCDFYCFNISKSINISFLCVFQDEVYENTAKVLIPSVTNGFNATVFAYGATGKYRNIIMAYDSKLATTHCMGIGRAARLVGCVLHGAWLQGEKYMRVFHLKTSIFGEFHI